MIDLPSISYVNILTHNIHTHIHTQQTCLMGKYEYKSILFLLVYYQILAHGDLIHQNSLSDN